MIQQKDNLILDDEVSWEGVEAEFWQKQVMQQSVHHVRRGVGYDIQSIVSE